jgi:putative sigma-54 modulation protein
MNISIKGTHVDLTPSIKEYIQEKIGNLGKFIEVYEAKVELARDKHHHTGLVFHADINLVVGKKIMYAKAEGEDAYAAIDLLIPKLKEQIGKFKDKKQTLIRRGARSAKRKI